MKEAETAARETARGAAGWDGRRNAAADMPPRMARQTKRLMASNSGAGGGWIEPLADDAGEQAGGEAAEAHCGN